jgi:catechol 2,3-dioxygenase-like lactoylglutathione lyase family enzyme
MKVLFVAGFGPIAADVAASRALYSEALGLPLEADEEGYLHSEAVAGVKSFGVWPLPLAAESCFGTREWPPGLPIPQAWLEFDVDDIETATHELQEKGYRVLVPVKKEPWGQIVTRFLGPEGLLVGVTFTPALRESS